jgi:hypothetical protein
MTKEEFTEAWEGWIPASMHEEFLRDIEFFSHSEISKPIGHVEIHEFWTVLRETLQAEMLQTPEVRKLFNYQSIVFDQTTGELANKLVAAIQNTRSK